jgi:hypothetical protein
MLNKKTKKMKKQFYSLMMLFGIIALSTACTTTRISGTGVNFQPFSEIKPVQVNLVVDSSKKIEGTSKSTYLLMNPLLRFGQKNYADGGFRGFNSKTKAAATYNAIKSSGADVVVNPQYEIKKVNGFLWLWSTHQVTVTGYKANYEIQK